MFTGSLPFDLIFSIDFPPQYQGWENTDPVSLFSAPTLKKEAGKVQTSLFSLQDKCAQAFEKGRQGNGLSRPLARL